MLLDLLAVTFMLVLLFSGMRLLYGAWPWEAEKTWYHARQAVEYVVALRRAHREQAVRRVAGASETSNDNFAGSLLSVRLMCDDSKDSFDRSLIADDNSPPEVATAPEVSPAADQLTPLRSA